MIMIVFLGLLMPFIFHCTAAKFDCKLPSEQEKQAKTFSDIVNKQANEIMEDKQDKAYNFTTFFDMINLLPDCCLTEFQICAKKIGKMIDCDKLAHMAMNSQFDFRPMGYIMYALMHHKDAKCRNEVMENQEIVKKVVGFLMKAMANHMMCVGQ